MFVDVITSCPCRAGDDVLLRLKGSEVTINYFEQNGFKKPIIVEQKDGLGLRVPPPDFRISDVEQYVGEWLILMCMYVLMG